MRRWMLAALVAILGVGAWGDARSQTTIENVTVEAIEDIVRDYLIENPDVVYEALQELRRRQEEAQQQQQLSYLSDMRQEMEQGAFTGIGGNPDGDVTLVEFFDYRCSFCRRMIPALKQLLEDDGNIRLVFKELPVLGPDSVRAAKASMASQFQNRYEDYHFALMNAQDLSEDNLVAMAENLGMDGDQLRIDMEDPAIDAAINANYALARGLGIEGTPAFVIGDELAPGAVPMTELVQLVENARASCTTCLTN